MQDMKRRTLVREMVNDSGGRLGGAAGRDYVPGSMLDYLQTDTNADIATQTK